jgi:hypothetical protein
VRLCVQSRSVIKVCGPNPGTDSSTVIVIVNVIYLLTLHISIILRIDSEERMVFLGGHPAKY